MRRWNKIGVEDTNEFSPRGREAPLKGAGFESGAIRPVNQLHIETAPAQFRRAIRRDLARIIGRIIQHLDLQTDHVDNPVG